MHRSFRLDGVVAAVLVLLAGLGLGTILPGARWLEWAAWGVAGLIFLATVLGLGPDDGPDLREPPPDP